MWTRALTSAVWLRVCVCVCVCVLLLLQAVGFGAVPYVAEKKVAFDLVIECVGTAAALETALELVAEGV